MVSVRKWGATLAAAAALALAPVGVEAQHVTVGAPLTGAQESPIPVVTTGMGHGYLRFDQAMDRVTIGLSVRGLTSMTMGVGPGGSSAHIHVITNFDTRTGPIAVPLVAAATLTAPGELLGVDGFDYEESFTFAQIGTLAGLNLDVLNAFRTQLVNAVGASNGTRLNAYFNVHTMAYPAGEIRGDLAVVPEPGTYVLLASGLAVLGVVARRRRTA